MRSEYTDVARDTRDYLGEHVIKRISDWAWHVARPGTSNFSFYVSWVPGHLHLAGDIGNITTTHYSALSNLGDGISWMAGADFEYWASKTGSQKEYDPIATREYFEDLLNDFAPGSHHHELVKDAMLWANEEFEIHKMIDAYPDTFGDFSGVYSYPVRMVQQHVALSSWARTVLTSAPPHKGLWRLKV